VKTLTNPRWLYLKAVLLLVAGALAAALLLARDPSPVTAVLIAIAVWAFCRAYYFAFYVVERYADPAYRFSGLLSFVRYLFVRARERPQR
jgi:hypothetical protein